MSGMNDNIALINEWVPPSPCPSTFFSTLLGDEIGLKETSIRGNAEKCSFSNHFAESGLFSKLRSGPHEGLMERIAARAGFIAPKLNTEGIRSSNVLKPEAQSTFLMLSPGSSPTTLLESPVFLLNSLVQPSPTTGKFSIVPKGCSKSSVLISDGDRSKDSSLLDDNDSSSFAFKPVVELTPSFFSSEAKVTPTFPQLSFPRMEASAQLDTSFQSHNVEPHKFCPQVDFGQSMMEKDMGSNSNNSNNVVPSDQRLLFNDMAGDDQSSPLHELPDDEGDQDNGDSTLGCGGALSEDGYNWRKYGQKQVKGSEYPRSYYKCTHLNCQVKKKVERSHEGYVTEIIYRGIHNHPKSQPNHRGAIGGSNMPEQVGAQGGTIHADQGWGRNMPKPSNSDYWKQDNFEVASSPSQRRELCNPNNRGQHANNGTQFESWDLVDVLSTFSNEEGEDDQANASVSLGYDAEENESDLKRRKIESYPTDLTGAIRAIREPRVVVQTTSEVDILDDGYRWRKYGQKVVKGNPNPRSYYKCTSLGCTVRKHVERASHDLKSVITTYEGKHNHDVPAPRDSCHGGFGAGPGQLVSAASGIQTNHSHWPGPAQVHNSFNRFEGHGAVSSFHHAARPQLPHSFSFGLNTLSGMANLPMAGLRKMPVLPIHPFLAVEQQQLHQVQVDRMGFVPMKGEPKKPEAVISGTGLNPSTNSVYQQLMSSLPLGPQM
ncbi:hypothetical protein SAY86_012902 [Trapa natans]|uniref:WRKY domain-containing protein n=1 Tax=Trapa natans TaxID=22666 RepID=A0AAN7LSX0_TRANT|nr:hypothetical protein SAY86_012902 [Trapa natans]